MEMKQYSSEQQWVKEEIKGEIKKFLETNKKKTHMPELVGCSKGNSKGS